MSDPFVPVRRLEVEEVALLFRVPYWLIDASRPRPSWLRRPLWRLRAIIWQRR